MESGMIQTTKEGRMWKENDDFITPEAIEKLMPLADKINMSKFKEGQEQHMKPKQVQDSIVKSVIEQFRDRSEVGIKKYGVTLDREDLSLLDWLIHSREEMMDNILYIEKAIQIIQNES